MKDALTIKRVQQLHPLVVNDFRNFITEAENFLNITLRVTQGMRTFGEQQELYDMGRTKPGKIVTKAKPGASYHQYGLAVDLVQLIGKQVDWDFDMASLVPFALKYGIEWGGHWVGFKDLPHFQKTLGYGWRELLAKYQAKDFIPGTEFVKLTAGERAGKKAG